MSSSEPTPDVSVIVPMYNASRTIERCIHSVLQQGSAECEIVVVDDHSTDESRALVEAIEDPRVRLLQTEQNSGPGGARNVGIKGARGRWIAILDADDWWTHDRLERMLNESSRRFEIIVDDPAYVVIGGEEPTTTLLRHLGLTCGGPKELGFETLLRHQILQFKPLISRAFLAREGILYDPTLRLGEDQIFFLDCLVRGARVYLVPEPHYLYEVPNSPPRASRQIEFLNELERFASRQSHLEGTRQKALSDFVEMRKAEFAFRRLIWAWRGGERTSEKGPPQPGARHLARAALRLLAEYVRIRVPALSTWPLVKSGTL